MGRCPISRCARWLTGACRLPWAEVFAPSNLMTRCEQHTLPGSSATSLCSRPARVVAQPGALVSSHRLTREARRRAPACRQDQDVIDASIAALLRLPSCGIVRRQLLAVSWLESPIGIQQQPDITVCTQAAAGRQPGKQSHSCLACPAGALSGGVRQPSCARWQSADLVHKLHPQALSLIIIQSVCAQAAAGRQRGNQSRSCRACRAGAL